ncbi:MAG: CPBP family intramembrane metalloprotease [Chloroflexi bacterium]|nr:CPBP family intramembrane metalloprotease [Chloroflexota bacterium]
MQRDEVLTPRRPWPTGRQVTVVMTVGLVLGLVGGGWLSLQRVLPGSGGFALGLWSAVLLGIGILVFAGGLGAYVMAPGFQGGGAAWRDVGSHRLVVMSTMLIAVLSSLGPLLYALLRSGSAFAGADGGICSVGGFLTAALSVDAALLGVTYFRFIRPRVITAADLGLAPPRLGRDARIGLLVGVVALGMNVGINALLDRFGIRQTQLQDLSCVRGFPALGFLAIVLAGGLIAPIAEELFFRGFVFRSYLRTRGPLVAYAISSLAFATLHLNLPAVPAIIALALMFAWIYQRTGSIVPNVVGHALNNSVAFMALYFAGSMP